MNIVCMWSSSAIIRIPTFARRSGLKVAGTYFSERFEPVEERLVGAPNGGPGKAVRDFRWIEVLQRGLLHSRVDLGVATGRDDADVAEPASQSSALRIRSTTYRPQEVTCWCHSSSDGTSTRPSTYTLVRMPQESQE